jgi:uncharacterized protein (TIGR02284 family)
LNRLIETSRDGETGYRTAAQHVHNTQLQAIFEEYSRQRARFAQQLQSEVERLGGDARASGALSAAVYRGWINVKSALSGGDGGAIIAACEAGEVNSLAAYQRVLDMDISGETRALVSSQFQQIREAQQHMSRLRESINKVGETPKTQEARGKA